ncbi:MAG: metallophosphoesterase [Labilithrix sp.]|nr:metallophosphoesterase [Labilithrix sp.]
MSGLAHALAARWVLAAFPRLARRRRTVWAIAAAMSVMPIIARAMTSRAYASASSTFYAIATIEVAALVIAIVPVTAISLAIAGRKKREAREVPAEAREIVGRREAVSRGLGVAVFGATAGTLGWGSLRGRHDFALEEVVVRVAGWPRALEGYTIAQVSDVHVGAFVGERELGEGFELVARARPDLVVATGDLVDFRADVIDLLAAKLASVGARDGAACIVGNHDHYAGAAEVVERLRAARLNVLCNESLHLRRGDGGGFALLGVDDLQGRTRPQPGHHGPDLSRALANVSPDLPRILLAHQPRYFLESAGRVALQLSGHTHGGQINPGFRPADLLMTFVAGRYERAGSTLWVNRGFGVAGPPSRIGAPPEVTKIVIVSA